MIDKRQMVAGMLTAALFTTALPGFALAQDEAEPESEADVVFAAEGLEWLLQGYVADGIWNEVPTPVEVSLLLQDGIASGSAGCNDYTGSYEITEDTLVFGEDFAVTKMFREGPGGEIEQSYLAALPTVAGWSVDGYQLRLSDVEGVDVLQYEEAVVELRGSDLAQLNGTLTATVLVARTPASLRPRRTSPRSRSWSAPTSRTTRSPSPTSVTRH